MTLTEILALLTGSNPQAGLIGAVVLFAVQLFLGGKLPNLSGWLKGLVATPPAVAPVVPAAPASVDHPVIKAGLDFLMSRIKERFASQVTTGAVDPLAELARLNAVFAAKGP